jgi:hypothetical protein
MNLFELYICFVEWENGGKKRPVLIYKFNKDTAKVFKITSQYTAKSPQIKAKYFPISDWEFAGLQKPSYIDTIKSFDYPVSLFDSLIPIGKLSLNDRVEFTKFILGKA